MEERMDKIAILEIEELEDGNLVMADGAYSLDEDGFLELDLDQPIPRFRMEDIRDFGIMVQLTGDNGYVYTLSFDNSEVATLGFHFQGVYAEWEGIISLNEFVRMLESCIKTHGKHAGIIEYSRGSGLHFEFAVKVTDEFLDEAVASGLALIDEILRPIHEVERQIIEAAEKGDTSPEGERLGE